MPVTVRVEVYIQLGFGYMGEEMNKIPASFYIYNDECFCSGYYTLKGLSRDE